jgi:L-rhamnose 1-dehydrogenase
MTDTRRVALVTGASRGIGQAIAVRLAAEGVHVVVNHPDDRDGPTETLAMIAEAGGSAVSFQADVSRMEDLRAMFAFVRGEFGGLDVLVNNAGICPFASLFDVTEDLWDSIHSVNLKGAFFASQHAARIMLEQGRGGRIIALSSISAHVGGIEEIAYCPTKSGIRSLMQSLCLTLGPHGITCNSVSPGTIETDINAEFFRDPAVLNDYVRRIPVGRLGHANEVAAAVAFLASDDARYINGAEIVVDGGVLVNPL